MRQSIRLGRVAGIRLGLNGGALVIVVLLAAGLAFGRLPAIYPGHNAALYFAAGLVAAALFLASILVHELAHALVARANGVQVDAITLWLLGGVAELRSEPRTPGAEFAIAVVGPGTSAVLGGLFGALTGALSATGASRLVVAVAAYLAVTNLALAIFNLVPAAPLDGGRVLRAAVWRFTGDRTKASVVAARAGRIFGFVLIAAGVYQVLMLGGGLSGLWWVLLGWFLVQAATAEEERARLGHQLHGVRVADIACPPDQVPVARPEEPLVELLSRLGGCADGRAVVVDDSGRVIGLVSPRDISNVMAVADLRGTQPYPLLGADLNTGRPKLTKSRW